MIAEILRFSIVHRWIMIGLTFALAGLGVYSLTRLNIDAVPDITNIQVQVSAQAKGLSPLEMSQHPELMTERLVMNRFVRWR